MSRAAGPHGELGAAVGAALVGATLAVVAAGRAWVRASASAGLGLPVIELAPSGRELAPGVVALALVALAGVLAVAAIRRRWRVGVGVVVALAGVGVIALTVGTGTMGDADAVAAERAGVVLGATAPVLTGVARTPWPLVAVAAGALVAAGGGLIAVRGRRWVELGRRYESPAGAPAPDRNPRERRLWDALDRGEDPTS